MRQSKKAIMLIAMLMGMIVFLSTCISRQEAPPDPRGPWFSGAASCRSCHQSIFDAYQNTAHNHSTLPASKNNVLGSFDADKNSFAFAQGGKVVMEQRDSGLYQVAYVNGKEMEAHRMDIAFGLRHAQTFLYWKGNQTYELPISFYNSVNAWGTSPGYSSETINFRRFIGGNCFECHSSYINSKLEASTAGIQEVLDSNTLIYGIDCERCHGPGRDHVNFHTENPGVKEARHMVSIPRLSRMQKLDLCAVCHSGNNKIVEKSTFKFKPGDTLANFFSLWPIENSQAGFDVHGNQHQLLSESKCFQKSLTLDCSSCHNPHANAGNNLQAYSQVCGNCHQSVNHSFAKDEASVKQLQQNCIDCHMPKQASRAISFQLAGSNLKSPYLLRTHKIAVYEKGGKELGIRN